MATVNTAPAKVAGGEHRFVLYGIDWQSYEAMLTACERSNARIAYDQGTLELMSPLPIHEMYANSLGRIIDFICLEFDIRFGAFGSTTFRSEAKKKGIEPDKCFFFESVDRLRPKNKIGWDEALDPPPDLAIEVDNTSSSVDKLGIYAALGVAEVWRFDGEMISVHQLQTNFTYAIVSGSIAFPWLPLGEVVCRVLEHESGQDLEWMRNLLNWIREDVRMSYESYQE